MSYIIKKMFKIERRFFYVEKSISISFSVKYFAV